MRLGAYATIAVSLLLIPIASCGEDAAAAFEITATIAAGEEPADGFTPGDAVAGGSVRIYEGDDLIAETTLDLAGATEMQVAAGSYTVQVMIESDAPGCFWGSTLNDVDLPRDLSLEVTHICSGD